MKTKKILRNLFLTFLLLIVVLFVAFFGFWIIDGRSPQAYIVTKMFPQITMERYHQAKADTTDKSAVEIPG